MVAWIDALARTRRTVSDKLRRIFRAPAADDVSLEELEEALIRADVAPRLAAEWMARLDLAYRNLRGPRREALARLMTDALPDTAPSLPRGAPGAPRTVLVVGINGAGKTTTCAKLAWRAAREGARPLLAAADTFRAAGSVQLKLWAERLGVDAVAGQTGADAAATAYDALDAACARGTDLLIVDTAGRMHTRQPLMQELDKVRRALDKRRPGAPEDIWIVLDATIGQNALSQAREFHRCAPLTGAIITKLDGSAKAGFVFSVSKELGVPILFAGLGERAEDLQPFERTEFVRALLALDSETSEETKSS